MKKRTAGKRNKTGTWDIQVLFSNFFKQIISCSLSSSFSASLEASRVVGFLSNYGNIMGLQVFVRVFWLTLAHNGQTVFLKKVLCWEVEYKKMKRELKCIPSATSSESKGKKHQINKLIRSGQVHLAGLYPLTEKKSNLCKVIKPHKNGRGCFF